MLIRMRMLGYGRSSRQVWAAIAELWLTFAAIGAVLWAVGRLLGQPSAGNAMGEFTDIGRRFAEADARARTWVVVGGVVAVALFVRLVTLLRRYMEEPADSGGPDGGS